VAQVIACLAQAPDLPASVLYSAVESKQHMELLRAERQEWIEGGLCAERRDSVTKRVEPAAGVLLHLLPGRLRI